MESQIILLPRDDYWSWVRACTDYVMAYGVNLTSEPAMAAAYMAPRQVITFPVVTGAYAEAGDMVAWFQGHHPGIRLDAVDAQTPEALQGELAERIAKHDRYGQKRRPFYLLWPTDYPLITQRFGANPQIYSRFGVPAHEGLDIRAPSNSNIYCCFDGVVYEVHTNPHDHPYGLHVRVRHRDGYKTVYAHLARWLVKEGDTVKEGQVIGKADSTGASTGAHLHLTLKRDGATERKETTYPKDILDPTPFMVWPEGSVQRPAAKGWTAERCLIGAHGRVGAPLAEADLALVAAARLEAVKIGLAESQETVSRLRSLNPGMLLVARATADFSGEAVTPERFLAAVEPDVGRLYRLGVRHFEVHATPNLQQAGWRRTWEGGSAFGGWFRTVLETLRRSCPEARFGFPGLSPGEAIPGWSEEAGRFLEEAEAAALAADWIGVNCHWTDTAGLTSPAAGRSFETYRVLFPDRLLFVTEFSNPLAAVAPSVRAQQYLEYYRSLRSWPGIGAAFSYALSAVAGHEPEVWRAEDGRDCGIAAVIGGRSF